MCYASWVRSAWVKSSSFILREEHRLRTLATCCFILCYSYLAHSYNQYVFQQIMLIKYNSQQVLKLLHISAAECHPEEVIEQHLKHFNMGSVIPGLICWASIPFFCHSLTMAPRRRNMYIFVLVINCILLIAFVGRYIDCWYCMFPKLCSVEEPLK